MARSSARDKTDGTVDKLKGRLKEAGGALSGNEGRKARGQSTSEGKCPQEEGQLKDLFK